MYATVDTVVGSAGGVTLIGDVERVRVLEPEVVGRFVGRRGNGWIAETRQLRDRQSRPAGGRQPGANCVDAACGGGIGIVAEIELSAERVQHAMIGHAGRKLAGSRAAVSGVVHAAGRSGSASAADPDVVAV